MAIGLPSRQTGRKVLYFVDVYANCRIKRDHHTKALTPDMAPDLPESTLKLRDMREEKEEKK